MILSRFVFFNFNKYPKRNSHKRNLVSILQKNIETKLLFVKFNCYDQDSIECLDAWDYISSNSQDIHDVQTSLKNNIEHNIHD